MEHKQWLQQRQGDLSHRELAKLVGIDPATIYRQLERGGLKMETVRDIARVTGAHAADELVKTGHLTPADFSDTNPAASLMQASDVELVQEVLNRMGHIEKSEPVPEATLTDMMPLRAVADSSPEEPEFYEGEFDWD